MNRTLDSSYLDIFAATMRTRPEVERIDSGLSDTEVDSIERMFGFAFPPDLQAVLQFILLIGRNFPNWRKGTDDELRFMLDLPLRGILFDMEHNNFWSADWERKPREPQARSSVVRRVVDAAPRLIPIYSHRFIPAEPNEAGNPVFSVHQTDIIHYGNDLVEFFHREFRVPLPEWAARTPRPIRCWDDALKWRNKNKAAASE